MSIVIYHTEARCKDCKYCGYVRPETKSGRLSFRREFYCAKDNDEFFGILNAPRISPRDRACKSFAISTSGVIMSYDYVAMPDDEKLF